MRLLFLLTVFVSVLFTQSAVASNKSEFNLFVVPIECWMNIVDDGSSEQVFITPDQCEEEEVAEALDGLLFGPGPSAAAESVISPGLITDNSLDIEKQAEKEYDVRDASLPGIDLLWRIIIAILIALLIILVLILILVWFFGLAPAVIIDFLSRPFKRKQKKSP